LLDIIVASDEDLPIVRDHLPDRQQEDYADDSAEIGEVGWDELRDHPCHSRI